LFRRTEHLKNYLILVKHAQAWYLSNNCGCWWRGIYQNGCFYVATSCYGVPVKSSNSIDGWDSVLSILQMPGGVPVATVALGAKCWNSCRTNHWSHDQCVLDKIIFYKEGLKQAVDKAASELKNNYLIKRKL
jgi:hypothetical protein